MSACRRIPLDQRVGPLLRNCSHGRVPDEIGDADGPTETLGFRPRDAPADGIMRGEYFSNLRVAERRSRQIADAKRCQQRANQEKMKSARDFFSLTGGPAADATLWGVTSRLAK